MKFDIHKRMGWIMIRAWLRWKDYLSFVNNAASLEYLSFHTRHTQSSYMHATCSIEFLHFMKQSNYSLINVSFFFMITWSLRVITWSLRSVLFRLYNNNVINYLSCLWTHHHMITEWSNLFRLNNVIMYLWSHDCWGYITWSLRSRSI